MPIRPARRILLITALLAAQIFASPLLAAPAHYSVEPGGTVVGFATDFGADSITGQFPISSTTMLLDFDAPGSSTINVTLDVANAKASFPFAAQAFKGPKVLDAGAHPEIAFVSTNIRAADGGARVEGMITIRGVTRPIALFAQFWQQTGQAAGDLSELKIRLMGAVMRSEFGATGWADMVGDEVRLDILAQITRDK
jgi:polyisoprenoid-binding protein YceI